MPRVGKSQNVAVHVSVTAMTQSPAAAPGINYLDGYPPNTNCGGYLISGDYGCCMSGVIYCTVAYFFENVHGKCLNIDVQGDQCEAKSDFIPGHCPGGNDVQCCVRPIAMCAPSQFPIVSYGSYESCGNMAGTGAVCKIVCTTATHSSVSIVLYGHKNIISVY